MYCTSGSWCMFTKVSACRLHERPWALPAVSVCDVQVTCTGFADAQQHVESCMVPADLWTHEQLAGAAARIASGVRVDVPGPMPWMQV